MMNLHGAWALVAQAAPMQADPTGSMIKFAVMAAMFMALMWFMTIAPQRKKVKEQESMLGSLRSGDKIVTSGGILGVVISIKDKTVSIRSADTKLEILKSSVAEVTDRAGEPVEAKS